MTVFTLASAGCALARSIEMPNLCRALQGTGRAVLLGVSFLSSSLLSNVAVRAGEIVRASEARRQLRPHAASA